jgi:hypothetical protein
MMLNFRNLSYCPFETINSYIILNEYTIIMIEIYFGYNRHYEPSNCLFDRIFNIIILKFVNVILEVMMSYIDFIFIHKIYAMKHYYNLLRIGLLV